MTRSRSYLLVALVLVAPFAFAQKGKKTKKHAAPAASAAAPTASVAPPPAEPASLASATPAAAEGPKEEPKPDDEQLGKPTKLTLMGAFVLPVGGYSDRTGNGYALHLDAEHRTSPTIRLSARTGFQFHLDAKDTRLNGTNFASTSRHVHVIPVVVGGRFFPEKTGWYVMAETGMFIRFDSYEDFTKNTGVTRTDSSVKFNLGVGIGGGYQPGRFDLRATLHSYDVTHFGNSIAFALGIGYRFVEL